MNKQEFIDSICSNPNFRPFVTKQVDEYTASVRRETVEEIVKLLEKMPEYEKGVTLYNMFHKLLDQLPDTKEEGEVEG